jgi:hypothetical protein
MVEAHGVVVTVTLNGPAGGEMAPASRLSAPPITAVVKWVVSETVTAPDQPVGRTAMGQIGALGATGKVSVVDTGVHVTLVEGGLWITPETTTLAASAECATSANARTKPNKIFIWYVLFDGD